MLGMVDVVVAVMGLLLDGATTGDRSIRHRRVTGHVRKEAGAPASQPWRVQRVGLNSIAHKAERSSAACAARSSPLPTSTCITLTVRTPPTQTMTARTCRNLKRFSIPEPFRME